jgi:nitric oxide reductase subunit B
MWFARSPQIVHSAVMETLVWLRVPGDVVFAAGGAFLAVYALRLPSRTRSEETRPAVQTARRRLDARGRHRGAEPPFRFESGERRCD